METPAENSLPTPEKPARRFVLRNCDAVGRWLREVTSQADRRIEHKNKALLGRAGTGAAEQSLTWRTGPRTSETRT